MRDIIIIFVIHLLLIVIVNFFFGSRALYRDIARHRCRGNRRDSSLAQHVLYHDIPWCIIPHTHTHTTAVCNTKL